MNPDESKRLFDTLERLENGQVRLMRGMYGDPENGADGIVRVVAKHEKQLKGIDRRLLTWGGIVTGASFVLVNAKKFFLG